MQVGQSFDDFFNTVPDFDICADQFLVDVSQNGFLRTERKKQASRASKRLDIAVEMLRRFRKQSRQELPFAPGPSEKGTADWSSIRHNLFA
jgi:hypothetical protein